MDDISVFRRFFVVQNIITELIGGITGRAPEHVQTIDTTQYGEDPFKDRVNESDDYQQGVSTQPKSNTQSSDAIYGFPS